MKRRIIIAVLVLVLILGAATLALGAQEIPVYDISVTEIESSFVTNAPEISVEIKTEVLTAPPDLP